MNRTFQRRCFDHRVGAALRAARQRRGLTLAALSCASGINYEVIRRAEHGSARIRLWEFVRLAEALGVAPEGMAALVDAAARPAVRAGAARRLGEILAPLIAPIALTGDTVTVGPR